MSWSFGPQTMPGQLCSKSNSRRIVRMGNRIASIKSAESLVYVTTFCRLFKQAVPFEGDCKLIVEVYYKDRRRDLDIALLQDCLQTAGIILNDRQVVEIEARRFIDKLSPRSVFRLEGLDQGPTARLNGS